MYIGSSTKAKRRLSTHKSHLNKKKHANKYLQNAVNKYGLDKFKFEILELVSGVSRKELFNIEALYLKAYEPEYNLVGVNNEANQTSSNREKSIARTSRSYIVCPPNGTEFEIFNLKKFCRENGLDRGSMAAVIDGRSGHSKGWKCRRVSDKDFTYVDKLRKSFIVTSPKGELTYVLNLKKFCRENNLCKTAMLSVSNGKFSNHKGWKCKRLDSKSKEYKRKQMRVFFAIKNTGERFLCCNINKTAKAFGVHPTCIQRVLSKDFNLCCGFKFFYINLDPSCNYYDLYNNGKWPAKGIPVDESNVRLFDILF
jgi:group I intron endonuclease